MRYADMYDCVDMLTSEFSCEELCYISAELIERNQLIKDNQSRDLICRLKTAALSASINKIYNNKELNSKQKELQAEPYRIKMEEILRTRSNGLSI